MKCVLVGNGTSVLKKENGNLINSYDRIVRFNSYKINQFEKFVGTRTTDWFLVSPFEISDFRMKVDYLTATVHTWTWNSDNCPTWEKLKKTLSAHSIKKTKESSIKEIQEFVGNYEYYYYSTGAIAAWEMLKEFGFIYLTGFDWWDEKKHHYGDSEFRGAYHRPEIEKDFFDKLGERVIFL